MAESQSVYGGVEGGGTKFVCAVGTGPDALYDQVEFPTTTPEETIQRAIDFFRGYQGPGKLAGIGIGTFGPVDLRPDSPTYGFITTTPKPGWSQTDMFGPFRYALDTPVGFDTDVNAAALAEYRWGAARGLDTFVYLTVGTGIGGGGMVGGQIMHGLVHPEMGHVPLPRIEGDMFPGVCPYHGACLEGLTTGPALQARWGANARELPPDHEAWVYEAKYLAYALAIYTYTLSPQRLILGGGVMQQQHLFPMIRKNLQEILNGYVQAPEILEGIDRFVVPPETGQRAGVLGAIALAERAARAG